MVTTKCSNCGRVANVYATDNSCEYCDESGSCIIEELDCIDRICIQYDVVKCECGFSELV